MDEIDRELLDIVARFAQKPARLDATLEGLGLDALGRARLLHEVERAFGRPMPDALLRPATPLRSIVDLLRERTYWAYPRPPDTSAADIARADFALLALRPALHALFRAALVAAWRYEVLGRERIPRRGAFVLVANHTSHADTPCALSALPFRRVNDAHPLAAHDYFFASAGLGRVVHALFNALPLDRHAPAESSMKAALDLLAEGRAIVLFPEGTRSPDGGIHPFKRGVGMLLAGKSYPAVPARIVGAHDVLPKGASWPRRGKLRVVIGEPVSYEDAPDTREGWEQVARDLEARTRALSVA